MLHRLDDGLVTRRLKQSRASLDTPKASRGKHPAVLSQGLEAGVAVEGMSPASLLLIRTAPGAVEWDEADHETATGSKDATRLGEHARRVLGEAERDDERHRAEGIVAERKLLADAAHTELLAGHDLGAPLLGEPAEVAIVYEDVKAAARLSTIPIIVLTTSSDEVDILQSYRLHANAYVTKPVGFSEFLQALKHLEGFWLEIVKLPAPE